MASRIRILRLPIVAAVAALAGAGPLPAQMSKDDVLLHLNTRESALTEVAMEIFDLAELGYMEERSAELLIAELEEAGFAIERGVAGIPTAFVATYGTGSPVIGFLAEYDALPGLSQAVAPTREPVADQVAAHACGHHLFGTASTAAAVAAAAWLESNGRLGTVRLYGTPAEEGGSGKVYMVRDGLFDDVDVVLQWHAGDRNEASPGSNLAVKSAKFRFHGVSAHAAAAPERARSALDGVEAMNTMVNMLREHVPQETRLHYVITSGGSAPNVVPDFAEVYYYARHPDPETVRHVFDRVVKAAEGAATGTETTMDFEVIGGAYSRLPIAALQETLHRNLERVGGVTYTPAERDFASILQETLGPDAPPLASAAEVRPFATSFTYASTDAGDVSWVVPTSTLSTATWVPGTSAHTWQAVAAGGMSIGAKGMMVAAKTLALSAVDLFSEPERVAVIQAEFERNRGPDFVYSPLLGDRDPPLDYRAGVSR